MSNLEDQVAKQASEEMQRSIDWEIKAGMLETIGWTRVEVLTSTMEEHLEMLLWAKRNSKQSVNNRHDVFLFQDEEDAIMFKLKWA